jgi:hypothetical protein
MPAVAVVINERRPTKVCGECGGEWDAEVCFAKTCDTRRTYRRAICIGCEQDRRDAAKRLNRWRQKAKDTRDRHARKLGFSVAELRDVYGWELHRMAHEAEHAYSNGCRYCGEGFHTMHHGLGDITLDIVNTNDPPYYAVNCNWCCVTCNVEKRRLSPVHWGIRLRFWPAYEQLRNKRVALALVVGKTSPPQSGWLFPECEPCER